jgi:hypothetical protein
MTQTISTGVKKYHPGAVKLNTVILWMNHEIGSGVAGLCCEPYIGLLSLISFVAGLRAVERKNQYLGHRRYRGTRVSKYN